MSDPSKGRARGRSRGVPQQAARIPQEVTPQQALVPTATPVTAPFSMPSAQEDAAAVGRSRGGRGVSTEILPGQTPTAGLATQLGQMMSKPGSRGPSPRSGDNIVTRTADMDTRGTSGTKVMLRSNFFDLTQKPESNIYQYAVSFDPEQDNKRKRISLLNEHLEEIGNIRAFDGQMLFSPRDIDDMTLTSNLRSDGSEVSIFIKKTACLDSKSPAALQLYNVIFRRILSMMGMQQIGRYYYHNNRPVKVEQHKIEIWPGFITSIMNYDSTVMLNCDISHKLLRTDTVLDNLYEIYDQEGQDKFYDAAAKKLIGQIVLTRYNNKTYRIDDINFDLNPTKTFMMREKEISYVQYYEEHYGKKLKDLQQPLLISRPKKRDNPRKPENDGPVHLIPELCCRTGISDEMREDFGIMRDIAAHTRVKPDQRGHTMRDFIEEMHKNKECSTTLNGWGLQFANDIVKFQARVMEPEKIYLKNATCSYNQDDADWSRDMRGAQLISSVHLEKYLLIFSRRDSQNAQDFYNALNDVGYGMGMKISEPEVVELSDDRTDSYLKAIKNNLNQDTQMVICILPNNRKERYDSIKKLCCVDSPVPSQVILGKTLNKKQMLKSISTKIAMQLNCKLGGELWALEIPLKKLMVIGIDCYHDSIQKGRSVAAFVSTTNDTLTRFHSRVAFQHSGQELLDAIRTCMTAALRNYYEINNYVPDRIIVYRDGVGDGQLATVLDHEVPQFTECFKQFSSGYNPKFTVIVVKKRINTRFFLEKNGLVNPPPGTIVDSTVTRPEWYDFFLVPQSVRQGTVTPTHYNVLHNQSTLKPDHIQRLTYKLCHLYYNWQGTVRVPSPCQYAHKLAFLVGQSIHKEPALSLSNRLFFL